MYDRNYYDILGIPVGASDAEIRRGYRRKAMEFHPDRNKHPNAHARILEINKAYEVLRDPNLKASYDRTLSGSYAYSRSETFEWERQEQERRERERQERQEQERYERERQERQEQERYERERQEQQEQERYERELRERLEQEWHGRNFYKILGVPIDASEEEINDVYMQRYMSYYKNRKLSSEAEAKFQELYEAYQVLRNPDLRELYNHTFSSSSGYSSSRTAQSRYGTEYGNSRGEHSGTDSPTNQKSKQTGSKRASTKGKTASSWWMVWIIILAVKILYWTSKCVES